MSDLARRVKRLEWSMEGVQGPTWEEKAAADRRIGDYARKKVMHLAFGEPPLSPEEAAQEQQDLALVAEWNRRHGVEPDPDAKDRLRAKLNRLAERLGEEHF